MTASRPEPEEWRPLDPRIMLIDPVRSGGRLLLPLEEVKGSPTYHPEGDVLYHSLQVFELARERRPYDEEFLLAALLHDVGKALDPADHVQAALDALKQAREHLQQAAADKGGHRAAAIKATDEAIKHTEMGIKFANEHHDKDHDHDHDHK